MFIRNSKRASATRPLKDNKENLCDGAPLSADTLGPITFPIADDTPSKKGTMARIKDTFFSPFRSSPSNSPKTKSAAGATGNNTAAEDLISGRALFSPGIAPESEPRKGAIHVRRSTSKRTPSRKPSATALQTDASARPVPPASSIPKLDLNSMFNAVTSATKSKESPRKDGSNSSRSTASPRSNSARSSNSRSAAPLPPLVDVTANNAAFAPVIDHAGNVIAAAPLPLPLSLSDSISVANSTPILFPKSNSQAAVDAPARVSSTPSAKPPVAPRSVRMEDDAARNKTLTASAKKREAPVALQSPAKRRRLSLSSSKAGTTKAIVLSSPGKAANLFSQDLMEDILPESGPSSPTEKIITHTRAYSCDREITDREKKRALKQKEQRERSMTITPMEIDTELPATRQRSGSNTSCDSNTPSLSPRNLVPEAEKFTQGTIQEIMEYMILQNESISAADSFFMAYSHFGLSSADLFNTIYELYQKSTHDLNQKRRIASFLSRWLDNQYSTDFLAKGGAAVGTLSTSQYARLRELMNQDGFDITASSDQGSTLSATGTIRSGSSGRRKSSIGATGRMSILRRGTISASATNRFEFMSMNHQDLANKLSVIEFTMIRAIGMQEFKNQAWNKADKETRSPHITALISHFNKVSFWVATEIVTSDQIKEQVKRISKFIKLAAMLREAGNLNGVMEIISGLNSLPVQRLRTAWKGVPSKHISTLKKLEDLMAPSQNFFKYRQELKAGTSTMGFVVPYIGVHLGDLVHISEGYLDPEAGKYDLAKILKLGDVLIDIRKFQTQMTQADVPTEDMSYTLWLHSLKPLAPEILEKMSQEHKEREMMEAQK